MITFELLEALGYSRSRHFVGARKGDNLPEGELAFAFRRLTESLDKQKGDEFHGAYMLQHKPGGPAVPVVYVIETTNDSAARHIHRLVWNQNVVPFLILVSPSLVRLYPGFAYELGADASLLEVAANVTAALEVLSAFTSQSIDDGTVWRTWGSETDPARRADESLLRDLKELDSILQHDHSSGREAAHGLIGTFVYLYYLRHRGILSDRKLSDWNISARDLFSRYATLKAFRIVNDNLQNWLNGSVFRFGDDALTKITADQLRAVAAVFAGDSPSGQLHLAFQAYNFGQIPIETLSCVYEQFLHDASDGTASRGKTLGAYYTPIALADYMISELERKHPLRPGMKVLDPSCGSGVFLVQCYRRLIEKKMRVEGRPLRKTELRTLLSESIFGIDCDDDACRVTELSLILTLLDYVSPPDLEDTNFKLPTLRDRNIFKDDFFLADGPWRKVLCDTRFSWCVGNPPWSEVRGTPAQEDQHSTVSQWMIAHESVYPTGGHQIAEAFLWKAAEHLDSKGAAALLVPAMTWFKKESVAFRRHFFRKCRVWCLANFANLAYVLFARRTESPASAVFYLPTPPGEHDAILTFAPFVAEQTANRPEKMNRRRTTWNIIVNHAAIRDVPCLTAAEGSALTWKLAMWGSTRDAKLLDHAARKAPLFDEWRRSVAIDARQGFELRTFNKNNADQLERVDEWIGKKKVLFKALERKQIGPTFALPAWAYEKISSEEAYLRKRGGRAGIGVSKPPHLILDSSRRFAVFSNEFAAIPSRRVGIAGPDEVVLRALSLYLSSYFCTYHQFFVSPQWGVDKNIADLDTLKQLPIPLSQLDTGELGEWKRLSLELEALSVQRFTTLGWDDSDKKQFDTLLAEVNTRVFGLLGLRSTERWLVEDFVTRNLDLNKGKVTEDAMRTPELSEIELYFTALRDCLDAFLPVTQRLRHKVEAITSVHGAFFSVTAIAATEAIPPAIMGETMGSADLRTMREGLRDQQRQWIYFDRALSRYERGVFQRFKPMQRLHWSRRQAVLDADEIIAETLDASSSA